MVSLESILYSIFLLYLFVQDIYQVFSGKFLDKLNEKYGRKSISFNGRPCIFRKEKRSFTSFIKDLQDILSESFYFLLSILIKKSHISDRVVFRIGTKKNVIYGREVGVYRTKENFIISLGMHKKVYLCFLV